MVAGAVEQVATAGRVEVEEDPGNNNDLFLQAGLEEVEAVGDGSGEMFTDRERSMVRESGTFFLFLLFFAFLVAGAAGNERKHSQIEPDVEGGGRDGLDNKAHLAEALDHVVPLLLWAMLGVARQRLFRGWWIEGIISLP